MDSLIKADVFFSITSVAVFLVTVGLLVIIIYMLRILRDIRAIISLIRRETENVVQDFSAFRELVKEKGFATATILSYFKRLFPGSGKGRTIKVTRVK
jgi:hypothetical protein